MGIKGWVRGEEEEPAKTGSLTQLPDRAGIFDLPKAKIHFLIGFDKPLNSIDSRKTPGCLWEKDSALS